MGSTNLFDRCHSAGHTPCLISNQFIGLLHYTDPEEPDLDEDYDLVSGPPDPDRNYWVEIERHVADLEYNDAWFEAAGYQIGEHAVLYDEFGLGEHSGDTPHAYLWGWEDEMELEMDEWAGRMTRCFELRDYSDDWLLRYDEVHNIHATAESSDDDFDSSEVAAISHSTHRPHRERRDTEWYGCRTRLHNRRGRCNGMELESSRYDLYSDSHGWRGRHQRTLRDHRRTRAVW